MLSRRDFLETSLRGSSLIALTPAVPTFLAQTARAAQPDRQGRVLVVIQLDGGNDGINTVVPFADDGYARHRRALRLPTKELIKINDTLGLHPAMRDAARLLESGRLAVVPGVGIPIRIARISARWRSGRRRGRTPTAMMSQAGWAVGWTPMAGKIGSGVRRSGSTAARDPGPEVDRLDAREDRGSLARPVDRAGTLTRVG